MATDTTSLNVRLQAFLKSEGLYKGTLDGKFGQTTYDAIDALMTKNKIEDKGWPRARRIIAAEQIFYKSLKIDSGKIDGKDGPQTKYAREVYAAQNVTVWRDKAEEIAAIEPPTPMVVVKTPILAEIKKVNWPTQSGVTAFYGKVGTNQADCILPYPMVLAWDPKTKVHKFSCHKLVKGPLERIWQKTFDYYGYEQIKALRLDYWGGCLNVRKMRGGSSWSMHSWGIAVDMDPDRNALKTTWKNANFSKPEYKKYWEFVYSEGAIGLGIERNYDAMHFQFARLG
jgi:hypothetical protein